MAVISHSLWGDLLLSKEITYFLNGLQLELFPLLFFSAHTADLFRTLPAGKTLPACKAPSW